MAWKTLKRLLEWWSRKRKASLNNSHQEGLARKAYTSLYLLHPDLLARALHTTNHNRAFYTKFPTETLVLEKQKISVHNTLSYALLHVFSSLAEFRLCCTAIPYQLEQGSISTGTRFHIIWNKIPHHLEQSPLPLTTTQAHNSLNIRDEFSNTNWYSFWFEKQASNKWFKACSRSHLRQIKSVSRFSRTRLKS